MASKSGQGKSSGRVPMLDEDRYDSWKSRMRRHLDSIDDRLIQCIEHGPLIPMKANTDADTVAAKPEVEKPRSEWNAEDIVIAGIDKIAANLITQALGETTYNQVKASKTSKEMWDTLEEYIEGDEENKDNKLYTYVREFNNFIQEPKETLRQTYDRFCEVVTLCTSFGKTLDPKEINIRFLDCLRSQWHVKASIIRDRDLKIMPLRSVYGSLKVYESQLTQAHEAETKHKNLSLCAVGITPVPPTVKETEVPTFTDPVALTDDDFAMFVKRFNKFTGKNYDGGKNKKFSASSSKERNNSKKGDLLCFNCRKPGHFASSCPQPKYEFFKKKTPSKFPRRKGFVAEEEEKGMKTWIESESEEDESDDESSDEANLCLIAEVAESDSDDDLPVLEFQKDMVEVIDPKDSIKASISKEMINVPVPTSSYKHAPSIVSKVVEIEKVATKVDKVTKVKKVETVDTVDLDEESKAEMEALYKKFESFKKAYTTLTNETELVKKEKANLLIEVDALKEQVKSIEPLQVTIETLNSKISLLTNEKDELSKKNAKLSRDLETFAKPCKTVFTTLQDQTLYYNRIGVRWFGL